MLAIDLKQVYSFILLFDNYPFYLLFFSLGFAIKSYRKVFYWGFIGAMLSKMFGSSLQAIFKVQLINTDHLDYGFPSGHLTLATFVYLWFAKFKVFHIEKLFIFIIPLIALATVKMGFHTPIDAVCGVITGALFFIFYSYLYKLPLNFRIKVIIFLWALMTIYLYQTIQFKTKIIVTAVLIPFCIWVQPYLKFAREKEI